MKIPSLLILLVLTTAPLLPLPQEKRLKTEQWLEDLEFIVSKLESDHPHPFYKTDKIRFDSIVAESRREKAQSKSDLECFLALKKVVASIEDGHTGLLDAGLFNLLDMRFPFRVAEFTDGVYIIVIQKEYERYLGSRLRAIDGQPIENILAAIEKVVSADNTFGRRHWALNGIPFARLLYGLKIIHNPDSVDLELTTESGESAELKIHSQSDNTPVGYGWSQPLRAGPTQGEYVSPPVWPGEQGTLHFKNQGPQTLFYWFEHLVKERTIYFQFNQVMNQPDQEESFARFSARMWDYADRNAQDISKFIIDLRYNNGGNGMLILPFLNQIIKRDFLNKEGSLFVISGRKTYSAASLFLYELAVHTRATFVGEPDGCGADLFSDSRHVGNLPHSGFPLWIASLQFTNRWPIGQSEYFMPDFPAAFSSHDYFQGKDPALDLILNEDLRSGAEFAADEGPEAAVFHYQRLKEKYKGYDWWTVLEPGVLEDGNNATGYALMEKGDWDRAHRVFLLNTMLFPNSFNVWDSLGECCYKMEKPDLSLQYYKKSLDLNSDNQNAGQMLERILREKRGRQKSA
jgi:tetratricopeptide (TPR) repeat protein